MTVSEGVFSEVSSAISDTTQASLCITAASARSTNCDGESLTSGRARLAQSAPMKRLETVNRGSAIVSRPL